MTDRTGQQLGNYRLIRLLGQGGFGDVYLGEHRHLNTLAAIKVLHTTIASGDVEQFRREARTIARLLHPGILRVLDFDVQEAVPFLVMDYAPGGTLRQWHPKGVPLSLETIVVYVSQVADALQYAHEEKVIHRDIKPENLLLGRRNELLLSDFSIALVAESSRFQSTQDVAGTIPYMAPEQLQGRPRPASDQYALGVVVYEWLCGDRPFHGSFTELYSQHLFILPPPFAEKGQTISPVAEHIVRKALAKDPKDRFESVRAFAVALEQAKQHPQALPTLTAPVDVPPHERSSATEVDPRAQLAPLPSSTSTQDQSAQLSPSPELTIPPDFSLEEGLRTSGPPQRRFSRRALLLAGAGVLLVSSGVGWAIISLRNAVFSPPTGTTLVTYKGHTDTVQVVAWSPQSQYLASGSSDNTVQVWKASGGQAINTYTGQGNTIYALAWSPDGKYLASGGIGNTVQVWNALSGKQAVAIYTGHQGNINAVAWSPDGTRIVSGSSDQTVQVWNAHTGGESGLLYRGHTDIVTSVTWSHDGNRIASASWDATVKIWDATIQGQALKTYMGHQHEINTVAWSPDGTRIASGSSDQTVQVWDPDNSTPPLIYGGHQAAVHALSWSPNTSQIASASYDRTVQIWDTGHGNRTFTYRGHADDRITTVSWSPDGTRIASAGYDRVVQVWQS